MQIEGVQPARQAGQARRAQEGAHLHRRHVDAHGLAGQLVRLHGNGHAAKLGVAEVAGKENAHGKEEEGHNQGGVLGNIRHAQRAACYVGLVQQRHNGFAVAQRDQRQVLLAQAHDGVAAQKAHCHGKHHAHQQAGQEGPRIHLAEHGRRISAQRHKRSLTQGEHAGEARQNIQAANRDTGDGGKG